MNTLSNSFIKKDSIFNNSGVIVLFFCLLIVSISLLRVRQVNAQGGFQDDQCFGSRQGWEADIERRRRQYNTSRQHFVDIILGLSGPAYGIGGLDDASTIHDLNFEIDPWRQRHPANIGENAYNEAQRQYEEISKIQAMIRRCFPDDMMEDDIEEEEVEEEEQEEEKQEEGPIRGPHAWVKQTVEPPWCGPLKLDIYTCSPPVSEWQGTVALSGDLASYNISFVPNIGREVSWRWEEMEVCLPENECYNPLFISWEYFVSYIEGDTPQLEFNGTCDGCYYGICGEGDVSFSVPIDFSVDDRCDNPSP
jgi:hypothetical protein